MSSFETVDKIMCCVCGVSIMLAAGRLEQLRNNGETFHCPNGHRNYFPKGPTEADKLRADLATVTRDRDYHKQRAEHASKLFRCIVAGCDASCGTKRAMRLHLRARAQLPGARAPAARQRRPQRTRKGNVMTSLANQHLTRHQAQAAKAFDRHVITKQSEGRWLLQQIHADGKPDWTFAAEIIVLAGRDSYSIKDPHPDSLYAQEARRGS